MRADKTINELRGEIMHDGEVSRIETVGERTALRSIELLLDEVATDEKDRLFHRELYDVRDEANSSEVKTMRMLGDEWEYQLSRHPQWQAPIPDPDNPGELLIPEDNLAAKWLYEGWNSEEDKGSMRAWAATTFPTALALYPLQRLDDGGRVLPGGVIDTRAQFLFTNMIDGLGLRSRAHIYADKLTQLAQKNPMSEMTVVSLGSGAGVPNVEATERIEQTLGKTVHWKLFDIDTVALGLGQDLVRESSIQHATFDYGKGPYSPQSNKEPVGRMYARAFALPPESVDVVDALGLWEYIHPESAVKFAKKAYELVKPGGSLIVSNMLPSRPQLEFNQRAVGWPGLYLRSESDLLDILDRAEIDSSNVVMSHATDGVYVVMEVKKL